MQVTGVKSPLIKTSDNLADIFWQLCSDKLANKSVIVITSKVVAVAQGQVVLCKNKANLAKLIKQESKQVLGSTGNWHLTETEYGLMPNAGIDLSNIPDGQAILLPKDLNNWCNNFLKQIKQKTGFNNLGVLVVDSRVLPLRRGIVGVALAWSGFVGIRDLCGRPDIYGKKLKVSELNIVDCLASSAQLFFGQADEQIPFCIFTDVPADFTDKPQKIDEINISPEEDLYAPLLHSR